AETGERGAQAVVLDIAHQPVEALGLRAVQAARRGALLRRDGDRLLHDLEPADGGEAEEGVDAGDHLAALVLEVKRGDAFRRDDERGRLERVVLVETARPGDLFRPRRRGEPRADDLVPG